MISVALAEAALRSIESGPLLGSRLERPLNAVHWQINQAGSHASTGLSLLGRALGVDARWTPRASVDIAEVVVGTILAVVIFAVGPKEKLP